MVTNLPTISPSNLLEKFFPEVAVCVAIIRIKKKITSTFIKACIEWSCVSGGVGVLFHNSNDDSIICSF